MSLLVAPCSYEAAKYACLHWHYSRTVPNQKTCKYGVWEHGRYIGAVIYGDGSSPFVFRQYGLDYTEGCELVRVALREHEAAVSQIVAGTLRQLKTANPRLRLVISFADPEHGHHGGIYQALNWIYVGQSASSEEFIVNGQRMHGRALGSTRSTHPRGGAPAKNRLEWARKILDPYAQVVPGSMKHRYLYPLDRAMRRKIIPLAQPYPRGGSVEGDTSGLRPEEAGSTPAHRSTQAALPSTPDCN